MEAPAENLSAQEHSARLSEGVESVRCLPAYLCCHYQSVDREGRVNLEECFVDATFAAAKGGGTEVGLTRKGKGTKVQLVVDAKGVPLALSLDAASVGETAMVQQTLGFVEGDFQPKRLIGDKGYDSDALDQTLAELGIEMISPHRSNRRPENLTQDGRPLRRIAADGSSSAPLPGSVITADS